MKTLVVPFLYLEGSGDDSAGLQTIDIEPWAEKLQTSCQASFSIFHFNQGICIRYRINEPFLSARKRNINGKVHQDNCVEFFIAFGDDSNYYNFEFNCLGSIKAAFGKDRDNRCPLPPEHLAKLYDSMEIFMDNTQEDKQIRWSLKVILPLDIFVHHRKPTLGGLTCSANFTKCGDALPNPHFLSWVGLNSAKPDFHQPLSFGKLIFEKHHEIV
jgi:hypothetical protein